MKRRRTRSEYGYNLVEMLIAMAMLGTVLLSVLTLFYFGRGNVYSGKQMTSAVSIGNDVMEDLSPLTVTQLEAALNFELDGGTPTALVTNTVNGVAYANSILRTTDAVGADSAPPDFLDTWSAMIQGATNSWTLSTAYAVGTVVAPDTATGLLYKATTAGISGPTPPTFPTAAGSTVSDNTVVWTAINPGADRLQNGSVNVVVTPDLATRLLRVRVIVAYQQETKGAFGSRRREVVLETVKIRHN
jgi:hypothetical protein